MTPLLNPDQARFNMVEQQIRTWEVLDQAVLDLLFQVKREEFVPAAYKDLAFMDIEIPLAHGETMMYPKVEARIIQELAPQAHERVLDVGTGSGYLAALLASRARHVTTVEIHDDLADAARAKLARAGISNVKVVVGDAAQCDAAAVGSDAYDVIVLGGSTPVLPPRFLELLAPGGRLFAVIGDEPVMVGCRFTRSANGSVVRNEIFDTVLKPLVHCLEPARFAF